MPTDPTTDSPTGASAGDGAAPDARAAAGAPGPPAAGPGGVTDTDPDRRHWGRVVGRVALGLAALVAVLVVGVLVFLQTETGRTFARGLVVDQIANVFAEDAEIEVATLDGNFLTGARLTGLRVRRDGEVVVAVDTVMVDYTLRTLLNQTFSASRLYVGAPRVFVRQRADSTFNVAGLLRPADDKEAGTFTVLLDEVAIRRGRAEVHWYRADGRDSVHTVADLGAVVRDFRQQGDSLSGDIERVSLRALAPFDRGEIDATASGRFSKRDLDLRDLAVTSRAGTQLAGTAALVFTSDGTLPIFDATVEASPFALEDVRAFAGVALYGDPRLRLRADSDGDLLTASVVGALDEATVNLDGEFSRDPNGPVRYRAEGTLRRFDPSVVTRNPALAAEVTGDLRLNLQGSTLETLSGPFAVALRETRVGGRRIDRLALDGSFASGRVTFDLDGALPGATLVAEGRARPFDEVPTVQVTGTARDVNLAVLLPGSGRTDSFAGDFSVVGRGRTAETFSGTAALDLDRAEIGLPNNRLRLAGLRLDAEVDRGEVGFDADATFAGDNGRVVADGTLQLGDPLRYEVRQGRAVGLNLAALTGNPAQDSRLTGTFTLSGTGTDVAQAPIDLTAQLRDSRYGTYDLAALGLDVSLRRGLATLDVDADLGPGGRLSAQGTARPFSDPLAFSLEGTVQNLDLAEVTGNPDQYSDLTAAFTAEGAGLDPQTMRLDARVRITEPSSYGERFVDSGDVVVTLDNGALALNGTLGTPEGQFDLAVTGRPFGGTPSFALDGTCFRDLDLSRFAEAAPRSSLDGCFSGELSGLGDLATADARGVLTLRPSRVNEAEIDDGRVQFTLADGALAGTLDLELASPLAEPGQPEGGRVVAAFQGRPFDEMPSFAARGRTEALDVGTLADLPPDQPVRLSLVFDVAGRGLDPATMTLRGSVDGASSTLGPVVVDTLSTRFALADGVVRVDTLLLNSDLAAVAGGGTLALFNDRAASDFRLAGTVESLSPLASLTDQTVGLETGEFALSASAQPGAPIQIVGTAQARQFVYGETAVTGLDADVNATWDRALADSLGLGALDGTARASFAVLTTETLRVQEGSATVTTDGGDVLIDGSVVVDERRQLAVSARVDPLTNGIELERGQIDLDGTRWQLLQPAQIALADGVVDVRGLLLATEGGGQQIAADGQIDFDGEQNLIVTVEDVSIDALTDLAGFDALGGDLSAALVLSGPATAPLVDGTVTLDEFTSNGRPVGSLQATVDYQAGQLALGATLTHVEGETLTIDGTVPLQFTLADGGTAEAAEAGAEVALRARADAFPIAWARPFLDERGYNALDGELRLDLEISGTQAAPRLEGLATITDGRLGVVATGRVYEPITADLTFQNDRIVVEDLRIADADGRTALDVTGDIRLRELSVGELDLTIVARDFLAMDTRTFDGLVLDRGAEPLRLTGTLDAPVLRGSVVLAQGDIYLTDELVPPDLAEVTLTDAQLREVEARFGRVITARDTTVNRFTDALDYDLTVEFRQNVWLRSNAGLPFDIEFAGSVDARKASYAESSQVFGRIELVRGTIETLSRRFELQSGSITLNGDPLAAIVDINADLDVRLAGTVGGRSSVTITLAVDGQFNEDLTVRLGSTPTLDQADIVSLIATGRLASEGFAGGGGGLGSAAQGVVLGRAAGIVEGLASERLGIELAQIDYEGGNLVIKFGDYLSRQVFWTVGYVGAGQQQEAGRLPVFLALDYELLRVLNGLSAQAEYSGQRGAGGGVSYETAW